MKEATPGGARCGDRATWRALPLAAVLLVVYAGLAMGVQRGMLWEADWHLLRLAQATTPPRLDRAMSLVSFLGTVQFTIPALVVLCATARDRGRLARCVPLVIVLVLTAAELVSKRVIAQPGPTVRLHHPTDGGLSIVTPYAFPSGHVIRATLLFGLAAAWLVGRRCRLWMAAGMASALLVGFSRVYLDVHWPSDVAGGLLLGLAGLVITLSTGSGSGRASSDAPGHSGWPSADQPESPEPEGPHAVQDDRPPGRSASLGGHLDGCPDGVWQ
jgi:membrane-associated phospholipid phosphatase